MSNARGGADLNYEVWHLGSANMIGTFYSRKELLRVLEDSDLSDIAVGVYAGRECQFVFAAPRELDWLRHEMQRLTLARFQPTNIQGPGL